MVPVSSVVLMVVSWAVSFALPVVLFIRFRKRNADILPFFVGCAVMLLFAFVLESSVHSLVLGSAAGATILGSRWLYPLYGGIMAGLFEETGRYLAFSTVLKKNRDKDINALMYGAGHGGFEAIVVLGITSVNNLIWSVMINSGSTDALTGNLTGEALASVESSIQALIMSPPYLFLLGALERVFAIILQIALSVLVWFAVKCRDVKLFLASIGLHFLVDALTALLSGAGVSVIAIEAVIGLFTLLTALIARAVWKRQHESCGDKEGELMQKMPDT